MPGGTNIEQGMSKSEVKHFIIRNSLFDIRYSLRNSSDNMLVDHGFEGPNEAPPQTV